MTTDEYSGIVEKIITNGKHGPYAVITSDFGTVTISLDNSIWREKQWPEPGTLVVFSQVVKKRAGWRAQQGRYFKPSDEGKEKRA